MISSKRISFRIPCPGWGARPKEDMSRQAQTESAYVQTVPDSKCLCPDRPRRKVDMSRLSCVQNFSCVLRAFEGKYVQTIPDRNGICPDFCSFMSRPSCVHVQTFVCSPDRKKPLVQNYSLKMKTKRVSKFHKTRYLRFIKKCDFKSLFLYDWAKNRPLQPRFLKSCGNHKFKLYLHFAYSCSKYMQNAKLHLRFAYI